MCIQLPSHPLSILDSRTQIASLLDYWLKFSQAVVLLAELACNIPDADERVYVSSTAPTSDCMCHLRHRRASVCVISDADERVYVPSPTPTSECMCQLIANANA